MGVPTYDASHLSISSTLPFDTDEKSLTSKFPGDDIGLAVSAIGFPKAAEMTAFAMQSPGSNLGLAGTGLDEWAMRTTWPHFSGLPTATDPISKADSGLFPTQPNNGVDEKKDANSSYQWLSASQPVLVPANGASLSDSGDSPEAIDGGDASQTMSPLSSSVSTNPRSYSEANTGINALHRTSTEPIWQRRLTAKNKELEKLHLRTSAPEIGSANFDDSDITMHDDNKSLSSATGDDTSAAPATDLDYTHASPATLQTLGLDPSRLDHGDSHNQLMPYAHQHLDLNQAHSYNNLQFYGMAGLNSNPTYGSQGSNTGLYVNPFTGQQITSMSDGSHMLPNGVSLRPSQGSAFEEQSSSSPAMFGQNAFQSHRYGGFEPHRAATIDGSQDAQKLLSPRSATSVSSQAGGSGGGGKGVIGKVIVPPAPGVASDAVDMRTGEAGQMRHVCPFSGCDKHFSTSGHARRHSRIHDQLRPFECPHDGCHATFTRRDNCTQHQRARHRFQLVAHRIGGDE